MFSLTLVLYIVNDLDAAIDLSDRVAESIGLILEVSSMLLFFGMGQSIKKALDAELRHDSLQESNGSLFIESLDDND